MRAAYVSTRLLDAFIPRLRRIAKTNLTFAFPQMSAAERERTVDGVFRSIGRILYSLAQFPLIDKHNVHSWIAYEGIENFRAASAKGKGVLIATAHFGNWELSAFAHALLTSPMHVMVRPLDNPLLDRWIEARRTLSGNHLILKRDGARGVLRALRRGEAVGILADQNTSLQEGVFVEFFGRQASASAAFVKFAHHSDAAVIVGYAVWDETSRRYKLVFEPEIPMSGMVEADTARLHRVLEEAIRRYPDQWLWVHRRWKTRPEGDAPLY